MYKIEVEEPKTGRWREAHMLRANGVLEHNKNRFEDAEVAFATAEELSREPGTSAVRVVDDASGVMLWEARQEPDVVTSAPDPAAVARIGERRAQHLAWLPDDEGFLRQGAARLTPKVGKTALAVPPPPALSARARELARQIVLAQEEFVGGLAELLDDTHALTAESYDRLERKTEEAHNAAVEILENLRALAEG